MESRQHDRPSGRGRVSSAPHVRPSDTRSAEKSEFGGLVKPREIVALGIAKDLPLGKVCQIGEDCRDVLPIVADPGQWAKNHALKFPAQLLKKNLWLQA